jgi:peptide/nickel transport system permease protein
MTEGAKVAGSTEISKVIPKNYPFLIDLLVRLVRQKPLGTVGGVIVLVLLLVGIFAPLLAPFGFNDIYVGGPLEQPSLNHLMGTDNIGRDLFSRIVYGARISMYVGLGASTIGAFLATAIGTISGYIGGKTDIGLVQVTVVLGVLYGIGSSRIVRSTVISIKSNTYIEAARAIGCPTSKTLLRHVLPNIMAPIIILFTINMGAAILAEASISFLGFGIPPPTPSWGGMLSETRFMLQAWWLAIWPGIALSIVVYGINMLGDALRDLLDPRLRGGLGRYSGVNKKLIKEKKRQLDGATIKN